MIGIPLFYLQELHGIMMQFRDNFNDSSLYWAWNTDETDANRQVTELATGKLRIRVTGALTNAQWRNANNYAPKVVIGGGAYPLEIIVRMESVVLGMNTRAGLYISGNPGGGPGDSMMFVRENNDDPWNGLMVIRNTSIVEWANGTITDDPIFLRIRIGNWTWDRKKIIFSYSSNGVSWIDVYTEETGIFADVHVPGIGMFVSNNVKNAGDKETVSAEFDDFKMRTRSINIS